MCGPASTPSPLSQFFSEEMVALKCQVADPSYPPSSSSSFDVVQDNARIHKSSSDGKLVPDVKSDRRRHTRPIYASSRSERDIFSKSNARWDPCPPSSSSPSSLLSSRKHATQLRREKVSMGLTMPRRCFNTGQVAARRSHDHHYKAHKLEKLLDILTDHIEEHGK